MLRPLVLFVLLTVASASGLAAQAVPLVREIDLGMPGTIALGEPFPQAETIAVDEGDGVFRLRPGMFGGAQDLRVALAVDGRVASIRFDYAPAEADFDQYVRNATAAFGAPTMRTESREDGRRSEIARWEDERTAIEVVRTTGADGAHIYSVMSDRALTRP